MIPIRAAKTVTVTAALVPVLEIDVAGKEFLFVAFTVATAALDQLQVIARAVAEKSGHPAIIASIGTDFTTPLGDIVKASGDLTVASTSGVHWLSMTVGGFSVVEIHCASGTTSIINMQASGG